MKSPAIVMAVPRSRAVSRNRLGVLILLLAVPLLGSATSADTMAISDNFDDGVLDSAMWEVCSSDPSRYVIEKNTRLEIHSAGIELLGMPCHAMANSRVLLPVNQDFYVKVFFNASDCDDNSGLGLTVRNAHTDSKCFIDEGLYIANGNTDPEPAGIRQWIAAKMIEFDYVRPPITERASVSSGTFYITNRGGTFYLSYKGFGQEDAFATFTTVGWTNCTEVFVSLLGWSPDQVLSGSGSYFDDFSLSTVRPVICRERPMMDFNNDCRVDFKDFAIFADSWLECNLEPPEACWQ